ncbi:SigE family RNA polymerase sigma factor [Cryptosporangium aurantiacum]|uniref:SigE family RNA polymerase sigma factor n=1 Tax=Cryptosporangium aurantiacum TaxID=134849 RepID=UPI00093419FB|nr:SigE family RNA polymerase sigma factor [Cryptosporangium aurantiacum]
MAEPDGFEQFVSERATALTRYGFVLTGNPHDAADLVQEALVRLRGAWGRVRRRDDPEAYVRTTMARLHVSWWRKRRRERLVEAVPEGWATDPGIERAEEDIGVWRALSVVPPRQRAVLVLRYYEGLGDDAIAERLRVSRATVRSQALRGLRTLREHLTPGAAPPQPEILTTERRRHV